MDINITKDEAAVIASLLELYDSAWAEGNHKADCECQFCLALRKAGEHFAKIFASLTEKVKQ